MAVSSPSDGRFSARSEPVRRREPTATEFWYIKLPHAATTGSRIPRRAVHELYLVKSLVHGSEVLWAFRQPGETLRLRDVMDRTGFAKGMCFRLLYTLRHCGFIEKVEGTATG